MGPRRWLPGRPGPAPDRPGAGPMAERTGRRPDGTGHDAAGQATATRPAPASDDGAVTALGYTQRLDRSLSNFALFALQFSYMSVVATWFLLFGFGYTLTGPSVLWSWAAFFAGQMLVALIFCELASRFPVAGSVYNWSKQLTSGWTVWMAGWMVVLLAPITLVADALPAQAILPALSPSFQLIGSASNAINIAENTALLGGILVLASTLINSLRVRTLGRWNNVTVLAEFGVAVLVIILLFAHPHRGPGVLFNTLGTGKGYAMGYFGAFLVASLIGGFQFYGFDTASSLAEETRDPHRRAPRAIINAMVGSFVLGALLVTAADVAIPKLTDSKVGTLGLPYIVDTALGTVVGNILLVGAFVAIFGACLAVQAAGARIMFGMARDHQLPLARQAAHVSARTRAIIWPTLAVGVFAVALLAVNIKSTQIIPIISSAAIATAQIAYLFVTIPLLRARIKGTWPPPRTAGRRFSLGRLGLPINILAVVWGFASALNLLWPRKSLFNPVPPFHWYLQYGPLLYIALVVGVGSLYYLLSAKSKREVLPEHRGTG
jgi:urea carboxylase system permease